MSAEAANLIDVGRACSNACLFCAQAGLADEGVRVADAIHALDANTSRVCFVGGEPTLHAELELWVAQARARGVSHVGIQTNGASLDEARVGELVKAGLSEVELTLHAPMAEAHDYLTGTPGSFVLAVNALEAAHGAGLRLRTVSALMRSNFRHAPDLVAFVAARGATAHAFVVAREAGRARASAARLVPRMAMAVPWALKAAALGSRLGIEVGILGAPACALGPHQERAISSPARHHPPSCDACARRASCPGLDAAYAGRFGVDETSAERAQEAAEPAAWQGQFAGIGPLAFS